MRRILFICTGNYYRSRYAEAFFNHHARAAGWPWRAFSRGLSTHLVPGEISQHTRRALLHQGIALPHTAPSRRPLSRADLEQAAHIIALKESEHRPLLRARFPEHASRVEFWKVHDLDVAHASVALPEIKQLILQLARRLLANHGRGAGLRRANSPAAPTRARGGRPRATVKAGPPPRRAKPAA